MAGRLGSKPPKKDDASTDMEKVVFTALLALGFNPAAIEQKERTPCNEQIFKRMTQKVGDHILHFLLTCISKQQAAKTFRDCWPIYDKKIEAQFRNAAFEWFKNLNQSQKFNSKPCLVISKMVVMPTSNKFFSSVYTLSRIALHSKLLQKAPSLTILPLPTLALKREHRVTAMQLIVRSKLRHSRRYMGSLSDRTRLLQGLRDKAKELTARYRSLVKAKEETKEGVSLGLKASLFLEQDSAQTLAEAPFSRFQEDMEQKMRVKNEEIQSLWSSTSRLRQQEEKSWTLVDSLIKGKKGLSRIQGKEFQGLSKVQLDLPSLQEKSLGDVVYKGQDLDLVSLFRVSSDALRHVRECVRHSCQIPAQEDGVIKEAKIQSRRVELLQENTREVQSLLDATLPSLLQSVIELRHGSDDQHSLESQSDSFALCPPTPILSLDHPLPSLRTMHSPPRPIKLTPSGPDKLREDPFTPKVKTGTDRRFFAIHSKQAGHQTQFASPPLKNGLSSSNMHSSIALSQDSGCVLSCGSDSLLQSLDQMDVTPKRDKHRNASSFHHHTSHHYTPLRNTSTLRQNSHAETFTSFLDSLDSGGETSPPSLKAGDLLSPCLRHHKSLQSGGTNPRGTNGASLKRRREETGGCASECMEVMKRATGMAGTPRLPAGHSPLVTKLLEELETIDSSTTERTKFASFAQKWNSVKEQLSRPDAATPSSASFSFSSNTLSTSVLSVMETRMNCLEKAEELRPPEKDAEKMFHSCLTSLESCLEGEEVEEGARYDFKVGNFAAKHNFPLEPKEKSEQFVDSRSYLDSAGSSFDFRSKFLPKESVFDTVTESLLAGEIASEMLLDTDFETEVRRESLRISRRDSVLSLRMSGMSTRLSQLIGGRFSIGDDNIFDESDSCLLSTSSDVI